MRIAHGFAQAVERDKLERIAADELAHFLVGHVCGDELVLVGGVDAIEASETETRDLWFKSQRLMVQKSETYDEKVSSL